ncbi:MAG TPA: LCP family protein [Acidimicrobiales bacterium]
MTDRFHQPERGPAGDRRRVFIPAPSAAPGGTSAPPRPPAAPPRPRQVPPRGPGEPPPGPRRERPGRRGGRVRWRRVLAITGVVLVLCLLGGFLYARSIFNRIDRVEVGDSLASASRGTNYLIVGSDSRENVREEGDAGFNGSEAPAGQRADTMMLLHLEGDRALMLSIPRDLYVPISGTGGSQKINAAYNPDLGGGPSRLIDTITDNLGIPIDRYMEVDFVSFAGLVDGLGGITIDFEHPARDTESGLDVPQAGPVELDGGQALAYVRSRHYVETIDGQQVEDPRADIGRMERQRLFLSTVIGKLGDTRNPFALASAASSMSTGLRIDQDMSMLDAFRLAWGMKGKTPEPLELEFTGARNEAGAVLILNEEASEPVLAQVR